MSASLDVLREQGPMTLRDLTRATAIKMGWSLMYADVDGVMRGHEQRGEAECEQTRDYRDNVWSAVAVESSASPPTHETRKRG